MASHRFLRSLRRQKALSSLSPFLYIPARTSLHPPTAPSQAVFTSSCLSSQKCKQKYHSTSTASTTLFQDDEGSENETISAPQIDQTDSDDRKTKVSDIGLDPAQILEDIQLASQWNQGKSKWAPEFCLAAVDRYESYLNYIHDIQKQGQKLEDALPPDRLELTLDLVSSQVTSRALKALLRIKLDTPKLSKRVRDLERMIGLIALTPLTDELSLSLLEANGKAGNVGRTIALLQLRGAREYPPHDREYVLAVQSIESAALELRKARNIFLSESRQPSIDNPTRFLDAILLNMHQRGVPLTNRRAAKMIETYACMGRTGRAIHFHYKIAQHEDIDSRRKQIKMMWRSPPKAYKMPSSSGRDRNARLTPVNKEEANISLIAALAFCDSLTHGACGHEPIELDIKVANAMVKVCCYRGALLRAFQVVDETMPRHGLEPDTRTYTILLEALARVGDTNTIKELYFEMSNKSLHLDQFVVRAIVDGLLNSGDIAGAITYTQDIFNQHTVLPPVSSHLKILEFALANELVYEAKRHIYFIQQLWRWKPNRYHPKHLIFHVKTTKQSPSLSKQSLHRLFEYFGETLEDADFLEEYRFR